MIMVVEWSGITTSKDISSYEIKARALLEWLVEKSYKFYRLDRPGDPPKNCLDEKLIEMSLE